METALETARKAVTVLYKCVQQRSLKLLGCNNGGGGANFSKVKRLAAKWIGTQKQLLFDFLPVQVGF